jgi:hypothetical protein
MTRIFVAPAQERVADGARRLVANEVAAEELQQRFSNINALSAFLPIRTIHLKTQVVEYVVAARGWPFTVY